MKGFHHILFPVDFSDRCRAVRPFVETLAKRCNARLTLLHVVHIPTTCYRGSDAGYPVIVDVPSLKEDANGKLNDFFETPSVAFDQVVSIGEPTFEITGFAESNAVDLIMLPTHGYGKFRSLLLGSVVSKVLHDAHCAVWTAAHTEAPQLYTHLALRNIMCAIDLSPESSVVIRRAVELAASFDAKIRLAHAEPHPYLRFNEGFRATLMQNAREAIDKMQAELGTKLEVCMESGSAAEVVRKTCLQHEGDLVIIGRGAISQTLGRVRSGVYDIIRESPCPVLRV